MDNLAILTVEQDARWSQLMELAWNMGMSGDDASEDAWHGIVRGVAGTGAVRWREGGVCRIRV